MIASAVYGTLPGWLTLITIVGALVAFVRGGFGSSEAVRALRDERETLSEVVEQQRSKIESQGREVSELRGRTDVSIALVAALTPINEWTAGHEARAQERHDKTMIVLDLIAGRLGSEPNGEGAHT